MLERTLNRNSNKALVVAVSVFSVLVFTACAKRGTTSSVTAQGTINLDAVKVGMPESTFTDAKVTFVPDTKSAATTNGKTQYLSRGMDAKKGQYIVECKGGTCFWLEVKYPEKDPITKAEALETMALMFPSDLPPQSKVDDSLLTKSPPQELYEYGDKYTGMLEYADKEHTTVGSVSAFNMAPDDVRKGLAGMGKPPAKSASSGAGASSKKSKKAKAAAAAEATAPTDASATPTDTTTSSTTTP